MNALLQGLKFQALNTIKQLLNNFSFENKFMHKTSKPLVGVAEVSDWGSWRMGDREGSPCLVIIFLKGGEKMETRVDYEN